VRIASIVGLTVLAFRSVAGQKHAERDSVLDEIVRRYPCKSVAYHVVAKQAKPARNACSVAEFAVDQIATGRGRSLGIRRADTVLVSVASVAFFDFTTGGTHERYWSVSIKFRNRRPSLEVHIDADSGAIAIRRAEE
jgi:hypothetical protein